MSQNDQQSSVLSYILGDIRGLSKNDCLKILGITKHDLIDLTNEVNQKGKECLLQKEFIKSQLRV